MLFGKAKRFSSSKQKGLEMKYCAFPTAVLGAAALSALASCGGSGGGLDPAAAQHLVGGTAPTETGAQQNARGSEIIRRSDSLIFTAAILQAENDSDYLIISPNCSGSTCTFSLGGIQFRSVDIATLLASTGAAETIAPTILSRRGVTIAENRSRIGSIDSRTVGSVLRHSVFASEQSSTRFEGIGYAVRGAYSVGDLSGSRPPASGTWLGLMSGIHRLSDDFLLGDAAVRYDASGTGGSLSATFSNISNATRNRAHTTTAVRFTGISVSAYGTFKSGYSGNRIQGGFYGSGHAEASGVFEQSGILGAFGALRPSETAAQPSTPTTPIAPIGPLPVSPLDPTPGGPTPVGPAPDAPPTDPVP